jgi:hypothetical protein
MSILDFISQNEMVIDHQSLRKLGDFILNIVLSKIVFANEIEIQSDRAKIISTHEFNPVQYTSYRLFRDEKLLILPDKWDTETTEYDIVSNHDPFIQKHLFDKLSNPMYVKTINDRTKRIPVFSNGLSTLIEQYPLLVTEYGLFQNPRYTSWFGESDANRETVRNFGEKVSNIWVNEMYCQDDCEHKQAVCALCIYLPKETDGKRNPKS